ncbi:MAG TPA: DUF5713 family protein [Planctomycetaceae bacterium]|nr:DUF5713 family protein [Planctomycetaceae bacterium]
MSDLPGLRASREQRAFAGWDEYRPAELVAQSEAAIQRLVEGLLALGPNPTREQVQAEIDACVRRFNELDANWEHRWINTQDREDISEVLWELIDLCGFEGSEEWLDERDW